MDLLDRHQDEISEARAKNFRKVAALRSDFLHLVLAYVNQPHNISACLRSAEAFGIQNVHVLTKGKRFKVSGVARGSAKWLDIQRYETFEKLEQTLKNKNLLLAAAMPSKNAMNLEAVPIERPLAIVFGNEQKGLDPQWQSIIDIEYTIPMYGFVSSFNISVAAAISLFHLNSRMREKLQPEQYLLTPSMQQNLINGWVEQHVGYKD
ncbi:MAG: RNA methyltransferase [Oligoflexales bacterium]|nr:RNA methyltransferase [Oligoflexales bacterium]